MHFTLLILIVFISSCSSLNIKSSVPSKIEMDGQFLCKTPCDINTTFWVTPRRNFEAFPLEKEAGVRQEKSVTLNGAGSTDIYFDMGSVTGVQTYQVKDKSETTMSHGITNSEVQKEKDLKFLKKMHEEGNINDQMYKELVHKALETSK